ncbi:MAG: 2-succinyl-6-hydroxy-2,4-cyclohexadiene-1-carboxylate synthase [Chloroflexota bacterium]
MIRRVAARDGVGYALADDGRGSALVLLHGFTGSGADWAPFVPMLARTTRVLRPDLLGHGASDHPTDPARHDVARQAADIAAALRAEAIERIDLAGYSFGARVALRLALDDPALVRSLFLESPSAGFADPAARAARRAADDALAAELERDGIAAFVARWEALPIFARERALPPEVRERQRAARLANDPAGLAASLRGAGQGVMAPMHGELGRLATPVTVLAGADDATGAGRAREVAAAVPGARLVVVGDAGHAPHREKPERYVRELATHLVRTMEVCSRDSCAVHVPDDRPIPAPTPHRSPA